MFLFEGENAEKLLKQKPFFDTTIFYKMDEQIKATEKEAFFKGCMAVNVDANIVIKQANLIEKLQRMNDYLLNERLFLNAPSFISYAELANENEELKCMISKIKDLIE